MSRLVTFLALTLLLSTPFWYLSREFGYLYTTLLMWCPLAAALVTQKLHPLPDADLGIVRLQWRSTLACYLVTAAFVTVVFLAIWSSGLGVPKSEEFGETVQKAGLVGWPTPVSALILYVLTGTAGIVSLSAAAFGEEVGWRGFLVPELHRHLGFTGAAIASGLIWALWHFPLFVGKISPLELFLFTLTLTGFAVMLCWFRLRSGSVWPAVIAHGVYNALLGNYFMRFTAPARPEAAIWLDDSGIAMALGGLILAVLFWSIRGRAERAWKDTAVAAS